MGFLFVALRGCVHDDSIVMQLVYVRFTTAIIDRHSGKRRGVFQAVADLVQDVELPEHDLDALNELRQWFGEHLAAPDRFARTSRKSAAPKAISWYKNTATEYIARMHAMCHILNEHGVATEMITSTRPGYVVFEDEHQIAAVPFAETKT